MSVSEEARAGLMVYSSKTGNTKKLAEGAAKAMGAPVRVVPVEDAPDASAHPWVIVGFWVDRGTADKKALEYLAALSGKKVGLIGTLGAYVDSQHARDVEARVRELVSAQNECLGCFLSMGKVDPALAERFKSLPPDHPHAMNEERRKRHEEAAKHPDDKDILDCAAACAAMAEAAGAP